MKFKAALEYDSDTGRLSLSGADCGRQGSSFSLPLRPASEARAGEWQDTPSLPNVRLTFDRQDDCWVCSDLTVDAP